ncbi:MAG: apiosidase-like domain-containing protein, partial [Planctomycetota bacterium]
DGNFSHRPNPAWFYHRVDQAVRVAYKHDLIADIIIAGPDTEDNRSILKATENDGDPEPILRYLTARYGSFPNVWFCLCNEFDIKKPKYTTDEINRFGQSMRKFLPYPTPISVHAYPRSWYTELNTTPPWHDHVIIQRKIKKLPVAADWVSRNHPLGGRVPVIDDELAYEGAGDGWSEADVIESHLGAFLGGGYGTTGHKPANKKGHYFFGNFKAAEHHAADNLLWLREVLDENITFWKMAPVTNPTPGDDTMAIFANVHPDSRVLAWPGREYVLGTNRARTGVRAKLPTGRWQVTCYDAIAKSHKHLGRNASDTFVFDAPKSRAAFVHFKRVNR